jgi:hypothetical protein
MGNARIWQGHRAGLKNDLSQAQISVNWPRNRGLERFQAKHAPGRDPGVDTGSREENASKQKDRARS